MILRSLLLVVILFVYALTTSAQGIDFFKGSWEEALQEAAQQEKIIFVDAYATWCGPCKRMSKNTFPDPEVGEFYNRHFISLKLDMERGEGLKFRQKYPVRSFPTLFFIDSKGEIVHKAVGALTSARFVALGKTVLEKYDNSDQYATRYEAGDRDPELVYKYVKALNRAGKPSLRVSNLYLDNQEDLTTEQNLRFILEATVEADSRIFDLLIEHREKIEALTSKEEVLQKIAAACSNTLDKAIQFRNEGLLEETKTKMSDNHPARADDFAYKADLDFYLAMVDEKNALKSSKKYAKKVLKNGAKGLHDLAQKLANTFPKSSGVLSYAESLAKKAASNGGLHNYYLTYANILQMNGKKEDAIQAARKSLELARGDKGAENQVRRYIEYLEQS